MARRDHSGREDNVRTRMWGATLLAVATALYFAAIAGSLYTLETAYYNPAKWELIKEQVSGLTYFDPQKAEAAQMAVKLYARAYYYDYSPQVKERYKEASLEAMRDLLKSSPNITAVQLVDVNSTVLLEVEERSRLDRQHNLSNSLLTRDFERWTQVSFATEPPQSRVFAYFRIYVTTAMNNRGIEDLTSQYRWLMIGFVSVFTIIYYLLLRIVLVPLSRVLNYMQAKRGGASSIISSPRSELERAYNNLARDATLTRFSNELRDLITREGLSHIEPVLRRVPELVDQLTGIGGCQIWMLSRSTANAKWRRDRGINAEYAGYSQTDFLRELDQRLEEHDPAKAPGEWNSRVVSNAYYCDILSVTEDRLTLLTIQCGFGKRPKTNAWWADFYSRIAQELRYAISSVEEQRRMILQEKSKANISLSRNLGHDLTNIIATSKLELMTVRAFLSLTAEQVKESPMKEKMFKESLEALLNNTRFLQEIVNLYRSFSYLQKPKFEKVNIVDLVRDVCELYRLSVSSHIKVATKAEGEIPETRVEPRLLRLALFNLLTNASDAIKRATSTDRPEGTITVMTRFVQSADRIEISVADSGTGICDEQGRLLSPDMLSEIFRLGFSTKANQEGEGLGLNWVQTIVREFHGGEISAANRPEGGASFMVRLPVAAGKDDQETVAKTPSSSNIEKVKKLQEV